MRKYTGKRPLSFFPVQTLRNHTGSVVALATDPNGKVLYSCGSDSFIKYWDIRTGKQIKSIDSHRSAIVCMHISQRLMYTGSQVRFLTVKIAIAWKNVVVP